MIEPMIRYNFLLYHADVSDFMEKLRDVGVVDVTLTDWQATPDQLKLMEQTERYRTVWQHLASVKMHDGEMLVPFDTPAEAVEAYEQAAERKDQLNTLIAKAETELDGLSMWGEFDPALVKKLRQEQRIRLRFFEISTPAYKPEWETEYPVQVISTRRDGMTFFVLAQPVDDEELRSVEFPSAVEMKAPEMTYSQKEAQIDKYEEDEQAQRAIIRRAALSREAIHQEYLRMKEQVQFTNAVNTGEEFADGTIKIVEGWSVVEDRAKVEAFAEAQQVIFTSEDARVEQNPPIKLKNGFFARLFEPITSLYMQPRYNELDLTPFFAPFFLIFFGMCLGDAGYGVLFILTVVLLWKKIPQRWKGIAWLIIFLNIATIIFGILTGNFFGIQLADIPALHRFKNYFLDSDNMFNVALGLGAVQILFGQIVKIFNRIKRGGSFWYGLSTIGWVILMITGILAFLKVLPDNDLLLYCLLGVSGVLILFFNSPKKNPFVNFGVGLYEVYNMITGVVGDLLSYIRLFALGLAGGIIAQVFNELAAGLSPDVPVVGFIIMAIILIIGHGINIFVNTLGAFVHPIRLTFVEFYKNADFEGGGREFVPFKRLNKEDQ